MKVKLNADVKTVGLFNIFVEAIYIYSIYLYITVYIQVHLNKLEYRFVLFWIYVVLFVKKMKKKKLLITNKLEYREKVIFFL